MPINSQHPEYTKNIDRWKLVRDISNNDAKKYLKAFEDATDYDSEVYKEYAVLVNFTNLTKVGLTGLVFRKPGTVNLPPELEYLVNDITGTGIDIYQFGQYGIGELLLTGRFGLLVDFPERQGNVSIADEDRLGLKAKIVPYPAESIINWNTIRIGSRTFLQKVVLLEEKYKLSEDGYFWKKIKEYRVLELKNGIYTQRVENEKEEIIVPEIIPLKANGSPFNEIPFQFIGAINNDWAVDHAPLYDIARINLAHYRDSADLQSSIRIHGQVMLVGHGDMDISSFKEVYGDTIKTGSGKMYYIEGQGGFDLLQPGPNSLVGAEMKRKEEQIVLLGARTITPPGGRETAEGVRVRYASQNSALHTLVRNMSRGTTKAGKWAAEMMGANPNDVFYSLNRRFYEDKADFNLLAVMRDLLGTEETQAVITKEEVRSYLKETNILDDNEDN